MRTSAFFANVSAFQGKKWRNLIISYVLELCLAPFLELWFKKIREVRTVNWHVISIVFCLNFCGETAYLVRFFKV